MDDKIIKKSLKKMKYILISLLYLIPIISLSQPSNDCADNPIIIGSCYTNFSITQATMSLATNGMTCSYGVSCPINYVNGQAAENFDCNNSTNASGTGSTGDDFTGSIENNLWWSFTPLESCSYTVNITVTNCCCKDKGSTNAAQYAIFDANAALPGGTIQNYIATNGAFTGTQSVTFNVTAGNPVYIMIDGLNGTDCDVSVSISPNTNCTGCSIILPIEILDFDGIARRGNNYIYWVTATELNNDYFILQESKDALYWNDLVKIKGNGNKNTPSLYEYDHKLLSSGTYYYRLVQVDYNRDSSIFNYISLTSSFDISKVKYIWDLLGNKLTVYKKGMVIYEYEDGTKEKIIHQ